MTDQRNLATLSDFVLDVLKYDDVEQLSNIRNMLNSRSSVGWRLNWPADFADGEIITALELLIQRGFVEVFEEDLVRRVTQPDQRRWHEYWFGMTAPARAYLEEWLPPARVGYDELE